MAADASAFSSSSRSNFSLSDDAEEYSDASEAAPTNQSSTLVLLLLMLAGVRLPVRVDVWSPLRLRDSISITDDSGGSAKRTFNQSINQSKHICVLFIILFRSYCVCLYDSCLWSNYTDGCLSKLKLCYHKCIKMFFWI